MSDSLPTMPAVETALRAVLDPELGENIVDLGLIESIDLAPAHVHVTLLPTSATCPMSAMLLEEVTDALKKVCPANWEVSAKLDWSRKWDPSRMSGELRRRFGWESGED